MKQKSTRWESNEIILTNDFNDNSTSLITNADETFNILGPNMIVTGFVVSELGTPGMAVQITEGIAKSEQTGSLLLGDAFSNVTIAAADAVQDRRDIIEMRRLVSDVSPESRQFKDPNTGVISVSAINTEQEYEIEVQVLTGTPGGSANSVTSGWEKIVEILVPASSTTVVNANIYNVDAAKTGDSNTDWTTDAASIYRNGSISDMKDIIVVNNIHITSDGKSHSDVVLNNTHRASDGTDHFNVANSLKGVNHVVLTNYTTTGVPAIASGSQCEINENVYTNPSEVSITGSTSDATWYDILLTPSGTTFTASFIARGTGVWDDSLQGLYSGSNRVVACVYRVGSTNWINKNVFIVNNRAIEIKMEIGDWDMVASKVIVVPHGIPDYRKIRNAVATIREDDPDNNIYPLIYMASIALGDPEWRGGGIGRYTDTEISLYRLANELFDDALFNSTSYNRGWITITYEV